MVDESIHGPRPRTSETKPVPPLPPKHKALRVYDIEGNNPIEDLRALLFTPMRFFRGIKEGNGDYSGWIWGKAFFLFFFFQWLSYLASAGSSSFDFQFNFNEVGRQFSSDFWWLSMLDEATIQALQQRMEVLRALSKQVGVFLGPFLKLLYLLIFVRIAAWGLRLLSASRVEVDPKVFFLCLLYVNCVAALKLLPGAGSLLAWGLGIFLLLAAARTLSGLSYFKSFLGSYVFYYVIMTAFGAALSIFVLVVYLLSSLVLGGVPSVFSLFS